MWGKIIIPMYRLWLHSLYGPRCPLSPKRLINLISLSLKLFIHCNIFTTGHDKPCKPWFYHFRKGRKGRAVVSYDSDDERAYAGERVPDKNADDFYHDEVDEFHDNRDKVSIFPCFIILLNNESQGLRWLKFSFQEEQDFPFFKSLWPSDAIWQHRSGWTLA